MAASTPVDLFYEVVKERLDTQLKQVDSLDTKIDKVLTYSVGTLGIYGAALGLVGRQVSPWTVGLFAVAFVVYGFVVISALNAYQIRRFSLRPDLATLQQHSEQLDEQTLRRWLAQNLVESLRNNDRLIAEKSKYLTRAVRWFPLQVFVLTTAALAALVRM